MILEDQNVIRNCEMNKNAENEPRVKEFYEKPERLDFKLKIKRINDTSVDELEKWVHNNVSTSDQNLISLRKKNRGEDIHIFVRGQAKGNKKEKENHQDDTLKNENLNSCHNIGKETTSYIAVIDENIVATNKNVYSEKQITAEMITIDMPKDAIIKVKSESSPKGELEVMLDSGAHISVAKESAITPCQYMGNNKKTLTGFGGEKQTS